MFDNIINFFKKFSKETKKDSKDMAKERLHLVLMQDRANVSADFLEMMKQEIIEVIKKYIDVDENSIDVKLTNKVNSDGTTGAPALYANIPIISLKDETKKVNVERKKEEVGTETENNIKEQAQTVSAETTETKKEAIGNKSVSNTEEKDQISSAENTEIEEENIEAKSENNNEEQVEISNAESMGAEEENKSVKNAEDEISPDKNIEDSKEENKEREQKEIED